MACITQKVPLPTRIPLQYDGKKERKFIYLPWVETYESKHSYAATFDNANNKMFGLGIAPHLLAYQHSNLVIVIL
jgi:hypothetical protein